MDKKSTQFINADSPRHEKATGPKSSTLRLLRQFARCYTPAPALTITALSGMITN